MADRHVREAARSIRRAAGRSARYHEAPRPRMAVVRTISPLTAEEIEGRHLLDDNDLNFTQHVAAYDDEYGIEVGDGLLVVPMNDGDYVVAGVISETDTKPTRARGTGTLTWPGSTSLSATLTVTHGLGKTPTHVFTTGRVAVGATSMRALVVEPDPTTFTSTQFQCRGYLATGAQPADGSTLPFSWEAVA